MVIDRPYIISELKRVSEELGKNSIPRREFFLNSNVTEWHTLKLFGSYNEAIRAAGLKPIPKSTRPTQEDIFEEMLRVFKQVGRICSALEFGRKSKYSRDLPSRVFGSWEKALLSFSDWVQSSGKNVEGLSVILKPDKQLEEPIGKEVELIKPDYSLPKIVAYESTGGSRYGSFINFRGLQHAPINEQGVVFLFGMICFELGFVIEAIRSGYPDCEAKRRIDRRRDQWERVRIEFEYHSSNFKEHCHDPKGCDVIVCWIHDWKECPLEVVELKSVLEKLSD